MRMGPQLEATRHLVGELALTLARQSRHHFPKQGRGTTTGLGCRRSEPLLALQNKPAKFVAERHEQSIRPQCGGREFSEQRSHTRRKRGSWESPRNLPGP